MLPKYSIEPRARRHRDETGEKLLDESARGIEQGLVDRVVVGRQPLVVSSDPAREIEYVATVGGTSISRDVVADSRLYVAVAGGRFVRPGNANVRRFLDSLEVTDPFPQKKAALPGGK